MGFLSKLRKNLLDDVENAGSLALKGASNGFDFAKAIATRPIPNTSLSLATSSNPFTALGAGMKDLYDYGALDKPLSLGNSALNKGMNALNYSSNLGTGMLTTRFASPYFDDSGNLKASFDLDAAKRNLESPSRLLFGGNIPEWKKALQQVGHNDGFSGGLSYLGEHQYQDSNLPSGVKVAGSLAADPLMYLPVGTVGNLGEKLGSKSPFLARTLLGSKDVGATSRLARIGGGLLEGVGSRTPLVAAGAGLATQGLDALNVPFASDIGGFAGFAAANHAANMFAGKDLAGKVNNVIQDQNGPVFRDLHTYLSSPEFPDAAPTNRWKSLLTGKGVTQRELDWNGVSDLIKENPKMLTKQQILDTINKNDFDLEESMSSKGQGLSIYGDEGTHYTVPGGDPGTYREITISQKPQKFDGIDPLAWKRNPDQGGLTAIGADGTGWLIYDNQAGSFDLYHDGLSVGNFKTENDAIDHAAKIKANKISDNQFPDQGDVLMHMRVDDRDGGDTLFVHEIQSDWAQENRSGKQNHVTHNNPPNSELTLDRSKWEDLKGGYVRKTRAVAKNGNFYIIHDKQDLLHPYKIMEMQDSPFLGEHLEFPTNIKTLDGKSVYIIEARTPEEAKAMVSNAVFENKDARHEHPFQDNWQALAVKRLLRYAADNGYSKVKFASGEQTLAIPGMELAKGSKEEAGRLNSYNKTIPSIADGLAKKLGFDVTKEPAGSSSNIIYRGDQLAGPEMYDTLAAGGHLQWTRGANGEMGYWPEDDIGTQFNKTLAEFVSKNVDLVSSKDDFSNEYLNWLNETGHGTLAEDLAHLFGANKVAVPKGGYNTIINLSPEVSNKIKNTAQTMFAVGDSGKPIDWEDQMRFWKQKTMSADPQEAAQAETELQRLGEMRSREMAQSGEGTKKISRGAKLDEISNEELDSMWNGTKSMEHELQLRMLREVKPELEIDTKKFVGDSSASMVYRDRSLRQLSDDEYNLYFEKVDNIYSRLKQEDIHTGYNNGILENEMIRRGSPNIKYDPDSKMLYLSNMNPSEYNQDKINPDIPDIWNSGPTSLIDVTPEEVKKYFEPAKYIDGKPSNIFSLKQDDITQKWWKDKVNEYLSQPPKASYETEFADNLKNYIDSVGKRRETEGGRGFFGAYNSLTGAVGKPLDIIEQNMRNNPFGRNGIANQLDQNNPNNILAQRNALKQQRQQRLAQMAGGQTVTPTPPNMQVGGLMSSGSMPPTQPPTTAFQSGGSAKPPKNYGGKSPTPNNSNYLGAPKDLGQMVDEVKTTGDNTNWLQKMATNNPAAQAFYKIVNPSMLMNSDVGKVIVAKYRQDTELEELTNAAMAVLDKHATKFGLGGTTSGLFPSIFKLDKGGIVKGLGVHWNDVLSEPWKFNLNKEQQAYVDDYVKLLDDVRYMRAKFSLENLPRMTKNGLWIPRVVKGINGIEIERPTNHKLDRIWEYATDAVKQGNVDYNDPRETMKLYVYATYREIGDKQFADQIEKYTLPKEFVVPENTRTALENARQQRATADANKQLAATNLAADPQNKGLQNIYKQTVIDYKSANKVYGKAKTAYDFSFDQAKRQEWNKAYRLDANGNQIPIKMFRVKGTGMRIFSPEDGKLMRNYIGELGYIPKAQESGVNRGFGVFGRVIRTTSASFDFATPFTHNLPVLFRNPKVWAEATGRHYWAFVQPQARAAYIANNLKHINEMAANGIPVGVNEAFEAAGREGDIVKGYNASLGKVPVLGKAGGVAGRQTVGRLESAMDTALLVARTELWKANYERYAKKNDLAGLGQFVRNISGALDSRGLLVSKNQRDLESTWLAFSPRLFRSTFALAGMAMNPTTMEGRDALKTLSIMTGASVGFFYLMNRYINGEEAALNSINPMNGRQFMAVKTPDGYFGLGGQVRAAAQMMAQSGNALVTGKFGNFKSWDQQDNPILKWYMGRGAPAVQAVQNTTEALTGANANPYEDVNGIQKLAAVTGKDFLPFTVQNIMAGEDAKQALAETNGIRVTPFSRAEQTDMRVQAMGFMDSDGNKVMSAKNMNNEQKKQFYAQFPVEQVNSSDNVTKMFNLIDDQETSYINDLNQMSANVEIGTMTKQQFRAWYNDRTKEKFDRIDQIKQSFSVQSAERAGFDGSVTDYLASKKVRPEDKAVDEYYNITSKIPLKDDGTINFDAISAARNSLLQSLPAAQRAYVERMTDKSQQIAPTKVVQEYDMVKELTKPYWESDQTVFDMFKKAGSGFFNQFKTYDAYQRYVQDMAMQTGLSEATLSAYLGSKIKDVKVFNDYLTKYKKNMRLTNPNLDRALADWYGVEPANRIDYTLSGYGSDAGVAYSAAYASGNGPSRAQATQYALNLAKNSGGIKDFTKRTYFRPYYSLSDQEKAATLAPK